MYLLVSLIKISLASKTRDYKQPIDKNCFSCLSNWVVRVPKSGLKAKYMFLVLSNGKTPSGITSNRFQVIPYTGRN